MFLFGSHLLQLLRRMLQNLFAKNLQEFFWTTDPHLTFRQDGDE